MDSWYLAGLARLKPGVSEEAAGRELAGLTDEFWKAREPDRDSREPASIAIVTPLLRRLVGDVRQPLLGRAAAREREMTLRRHLGASGLRLVRQVLDARRALQGRLAAARPTVLTPGGCASVRPEAGNVRHASRKCAQSRSA
jgi:hypothetical protein